METNYSAYIQTIEGIEAVQEEVIKDKRTRRCCILTLEVIKTIIQYFKNAKSKITKKKD